MNTLEVVITSYNQKEMILEALQSVLNQTQLPNRVVIVDDGSSDLESNMVINEIIRNNINHKYPIEVAIKQQKNHGVSYARNKGIQLTDSEYVLVLDGDDTLHPNYIKKVLPKLIENDHIVAASSYLKTFGVLNSIVKPIGGDIENFLCRNASPATCIIRKSSYLKSKKYDTKMKTGFEDWDFFISLLETDNHSLISIVEEPLINYRTNPSSSNINSMKKRVENIQYIVHKHLRTYKKNVEILVYMYEKMSYGRLLDTEEEILHEIRCQNDLSKNAKQFLKEPSYGDAGMASAVRIKSKMK